MKQKTLILSIIKDDLITWKLIYGLNDIGLEADGYTLYASGTIMELMKIKTGSPRWEDIHERYLNLTEKVKQIDIHTSPRLLDALAQEIYDFLKQMRAEEKMLTQRAKQLLSEHLKS